MRPAQTVHRGRDDTRRFAFLLFFLSGGLSLLYEVVWLRLLVLVFGSTHFAVTSVLAAFMTGLALGSFLLGRYADRSRWHPLMIYGALEIGIGLCGVLVPVLLDTLSPLAAFASQAAFGSWYLGSVVRFMLALAILLVPTSLMGGTLPVISRFAARRADEVGSTVGLLYGLNTCGAVAGTTLTGFVLLPWLGVSATIRTAAMANVVVGLAACAAAWRTEPIPSAVEAAPDRPAGRQRWRHAPAAKPFEPSRVALWATAGSGLLALIYEIAWTRVLVLVMGSSVYAFTAMLATFLVGLAAGALVGARLAERLRSTERLLRGLSVTIGLAAVSGYLTLRALPRLPWLFARTFHELGLAVPDVMGTVNRALRVVSIEFGFAFLVMFPATFFMGLVFPLAVRLWVGRLDHVGRSVGSVYAANTAGTIAGSILGGLVILPIAGLQGGILVAVSGGLLLAALLTWAWPDWSTARRGVTLGGVAVVAAWLVASRPPWDPIVMNSGIFQYAPEVGGSALTPEALALALHRDMELLYYEEGMTANVLVARQLSNGNIWMSLNGKIDASSKADIETQLLLGHLPMLLSSRVDPTRAIVIGYASGMTTGAVTRHGSVEVTAVEIEPAVLRASVFFDEVNHAPLSDPRVRVIEADGRSFLLTDRGQYSAIISEPSNPWMTIAANLFTREFFELGRRRLAPGGIFSQWIQLYGLRPAELRSLVKTFTDVFPQVAIFSSIPGGDIVLLGSEQPIQIDLDRIDAALEDREVAMDLGRIKIRDGADLLSYYLMGDEHARAFAADAETNTDDNALIEFRAPLMLHVPTLEVNARALNTYAADPLETVTNVPADAEGRATLYTALGRAFFDKGTFGRAVEAVRRAQQIHPTDEGALQLASYEAAAEGAEKGL